MPESEKGTLRLPFVASIVIDPGVVTSWSPSNRGSTEYNVAAVQLKSEKRSAARISWMREPPAEVESQLANLFRYRFRLHELQ